MQDYYAALGVVRTATHDEIKAAFRELAKKLHPDYNGAADAAKRFADVRLAYDVLTDPARRQRYDNLSRALGSDPSASAGVLARYKRPPGPTCAVCEGTGEVVGFTGFHSIPTECGNCFGLGTVPWASVAPVAPPAKPTLGTTIADRVRRLETRS